MDNLALAVAQAVALAVAQAVAWVAALGRSLAAVLGRSLAAAPVVACGCLGILDKLAFLLVDFLQVGGTFRKRLAVLTEVAQSPQEGQEDSLQVQEDTCFVVHWHLQRFLTN